MEMKNTLENKAKFFALYWGQMNAKITTGSSTHKKGTIHIVDKNVLQSVESEKLFKHKYSLELIPISSISDEDACHIAMLLVDWQTSMSKLKPEDIKVRGREDSDHVWDELVMDFTGVFKYTVRYRGGDFMTWIESRSSCEWNTYNHQHVYDYLRSKRYAIPWMGLSVKELVNRGWVKLKS